jgi:hypothetical protein
MPATTTAEQGSSLSAVRRAVTLPPAVRNPVTSAFSWIFTPDAASASPRARANASGSTTPSPSTR